MASKKITPSTETSEERDTPKSRMDTVVASETLAKIKKKYGSSSISRASDDRYKQVFRIPTNIFPLDLALGGGFQAGRVHTAYGNKSSSKTSVMTRTIAQAQKLCASCYRYNYTTPDGEVVECGCKDQREMVTAVVDVEGTFDMKWAKSLGADPNRILFSQPDHGEEALDICEALIRSGDIDILLLDSLAFLTPTKEIEESVEKDLMGTQPRMIGKGVRKLNAALNAVKNDSGRFPTVFFTNQIRMKLGVMFGNPETTPGGNAPGFVSTTEVKLWAGKYAMDEVTGKPLHADMNFRVEKNKSAPTAKMEGTFRLILTDTEVKKTGDVLDEDVMVSLAEKCNLVTGRGPSWQCLGQQFGGKSLIEKELMTNPDLKSKLREALFQVLLAA